MIAKNYTKKQALIEISKNAHPELSLNIHTNIINKFNDFDLLINFSTYALPPGDNDDEFAMQILNDTSIQDIYKLVTNGRQENLRLIKIWEDLFHSSEIEDLSIASKDDVNQIIGMFTTDKIDPHIFVSNLQVLLRNGMPSVREFFTGKKSINSPSIDYSANPIHRVPAFPLWFYAAYPDVIIWLCEWQKEYVKSHNYDEDVMATEIAKLFGINIEDKIIKNDQITNSEDQYRPHYLRNLVEHYKDTTDKKLEVSVFF